MHALQTINLFIHHKTVFACFMAGSVYDHLRCPALLLQICCSASSPILCAFDTTFDRIRRTALYWLCMLLFCQFHLLLGSTDGILHGHAYRTRCTFPPPPAAARTALPACWAPLAPTFLTVPACMQILLRTLLFVRIPAFISHK